MGPVIRGFGTERGLGRAIQGSRGPAWGGGGQAEREQAGFSPLSCPLISPAPPIAEPAREREGGRAGRRSSLVQCRGGKTRDSPELSPCCVSQRGQGGGQRGRVFLGGCSSGGRLALRPWQGDGRGVRGTRVRSPPERGVGAAPGRLTGRVPQPGTQHSFVSNSALCTRQNRNCTWGAWGGQKRVCDVQHPRRSLRRLRLCSRRGVAHQCPCDTGETAGGPGQSAPLPCCNVSHSQSQAGEAFRDTDIWPLLSQCSISLHLVCFLCMARDTEFPSTLVTILNT